MLRRQHWLWGSCGVIDSGWVVWGSRLMPRLALVFELDNLYERYKLEFFPHLHQISIFRIVLKFKCAIQDIGLEHFCKCSTNRRQHYSNISKNMRYESILVQCEPRNYLNIFPLVPRQQTSSTNSVKQRQNRAAHRLLLKTILFLELYICT